MKNPTRLILLTAILIGCSAEEHDLVGTYRSEEPHILKKAWKHFVEDYESFVIGEELNLNEDASFREVTCGNVLTGKWHREGDTLFLNYESNRWRNDSLQEFGFEGDWLQVPKEVKKAAIKKGRLVFHNETADGKKRYDVLEK